MVTLLWPHGLRQLTAAPRSGCRSRHSRGVDRGLLDGRTCYPQLLLALHCKRRCTHKQRAFLKLSFLPAPPQLQPPGPGLQHTSAALTACPAPSHPHSTLHPPWPLRVPLLGGISMLAFRRRGGGVKLLCLLGTHLVCAAPGIPWNLEESRETSGQCSHSKAPNTNHTSLMVPDGSRGTCHGVAGTQPCPGLHSHQMSPCHWLCPGP